MLELAILTAALGGLTIRALLKALMRNVVRVSFGTDMMEEEGETE